MQIDNNVPVLWLCTGEGGLGAAQSQSYGIQTWPASDNWMVNSVVNDHTRCLTVVLQSDRKLIFVFFFIHISSAATETFVFDDGYEFILCVGKYKMLRLWPMHADSLDQFFFSFVCVHNRWLARRPRFLLFNIFMLSWMNSHSLCCVLYLLRGTREKEHALPVSYTYGSNCPSQQFLASGWSCLFLFIFDLTYIEWPQLKLNRNHLREYCYYYFCLVVQLLSLRFFLK